MAALKRHFVAGRLSAEELGDRVGQALAAETRGDLQALLRDLPVSSDAIEGQGPAGGRPVLRQPASAAYSALLDRGVAPHVASYLGVMALLVAIWLLTTPGGYFWPVWPMLGWGIGVVKHAVLASGCGSARPGGTARV